MSLPSELAAAPDYQTPDPTLLETALAFLDVHLTDLSTLVPEHLEADPDPEAACLLLHQLRELRKRLADLEAFTEAEAAGRMPRQVFRFAGYVAERKGGKDRKAWDNDRLAFAVCRDLAVDADGVIDPDGVAIIDAVRSRLLNAASIAYWRSTQLKALGIDPDDYCESTPGRRTVHVRLDTEDES